MRPLVVVALASLLSSCASSSVTLLNDEGGGAGAVAVLDPETGTEVGTVSSADTRARVAGDRKVRPRGVKAGAFDRLLAWMPHPPRVYVMYFRPGSTELTAESTPILEALRTVVDADSDVQIVGHTDTTGTDEINDRISLERATEVRAALVGMGLPLESARVTGRGERELRVKTEDEVAEPANRRVEVILR